MQFGYQPKNPILESLNFPVSTMDKDPGFIAALEEARQGRSEGGVPIG